MKLWKKMESCSRSGGSKFGNLRNNS